jgi:hypothetical protein
MQLRIHNTYVLPFCTTTVVLLPCDREDLPSYASRFVFTSLLS